MPALIITNKSNLIFIRGIVIIPRKNLYLHTKYLLCNGILRINHD